MSELNTTFVTESYNFKNHAVGTKGHEALKALADSDKLSMEDIDVDKNDAGVEVWKRKSEKVQITVPVIASVLSDEAKEVLSARQVDHLQKVVENYISSKNRDNVDSVTGEVVDWSKVLEADYSQRASAAIKVSAEQLGEAVKAVRPILLEWMPEKSADAICEGIKRKFNATFCSKLPADALEKINSRIMDACGELTEEQLAQHNDALTVCTNALEKAIQPDEELMALEF